MPKSNSLDEFTTDMARRRQAEAWLRTTGRDVAAMPVEHVQRLVEELQVHQIELEMQNEELRQAQAELEAARDRYADLYDSAPIGYVTLDSKGIILEANLPACVLLGVARKKLLGQSVLRSVMMKDQARVLSHLRELFKSGTGRICEVDLALPRNVVLTVRFESVVVADGAGPQAVVRTALLDITARMRSEAQAQAQRLERQQNLDQRERLGHDLHDGVLQSLYAIGLSLETCKLFPATASAEVGAIVTRSISELNSVMREMRTYVEELESPSTPTVVSLARDLETSLRTMADTLARLHGQKVRLSIDPVAAATLSPAEGVELLHLLKEALSNSFRHAQATVVQVMFRRVKAGIRLLVTDNGIGFPRDGATGEGQGLTSMAARASRLGGALSVRARPSKGIQLVVDLPKTAS